MQQFIQHGTVTTYEHCLRVTASPTGSTCTGIAMPMKSAWCAARFARFYLYDWHNCSNITHWHGFKHPLIARYNADAVFQLNNKERNIIQTHMWPLTITQLPRCREACLVCLRTRCPPVGRR